jgi:4-hydroxybutyrate CoA-transferase
MTVSAHLHPRQQTAEQAIQLIQLGQRVFIGGNASVPQMLVKALTDYAPQLSNVEVVHVLTVGETSYISEALQPHLRVNTLFTAHNTRVAVQNGLADFTPSYLGGIPDLFRTVLRPDVALIQVSRPDDNGYCTYGTEVGVTKSAVESATLVIAEINPRMPRTCGDSKLHLSQIQIIVDVDYQLPEHQMGKVSPIQRDMARHIASLIEDGSTLQIGIGSLPDAVLGFLKEKRGLGIHTELFSDGVIDLVEQGVVTGEHKTLHTGKIVAGFVLGTQRLYDFIHNNDLVELYPTDYTNNPLIIGQHKCMISINAALEVDLTGQICADSIGHQIYSGVGGQVEFTRGAALSKGGKAIIALPSTAKEDTLSRIVWEFKPGAGISVPRSEVQYVVTEYGIAHLYGKNLSQRVQALINIAHPNFRESLAASARAAHYLPTQFTGITF